MINEKIEPTFVDANVMANWIIVSSALKEKGITLEDEKNKLLKKLSTPIRSSYSLLEKIKNEDVMKNTFFTSDIAFSEIFSVIGDEYRAKVLHGDGVPMRYWSSMMYNVDLPEHYLIQINSEINDFYNVFLIDKIVRKSNFDLSAVGELVFLYKCNTHDALLIAESLKVNCKYFVTEDQRLRNNLKKKDIIR